jgi:hypothetical protein
LSQYLSAEHRDKISRAMRGKRNAAGRHKMTPEGRAAIQAAQAERWARWRAAKREEQTT